MKIKSSTAITPFLEEILLHYSGLTYPLNKQSKEIRHLAENVKIISNEYVFSKLSLEKDIFKKKNLIKAYLTYYLPVNLVKLHPIMDELLRCMENPFKNKTFSMLDIGCGPGTFIISFLEYILKNSASLKFNPKKVNILGIDKRKENLLMAKQIVDTYLTNYPLSSTTDWQLEFTHGSFASESSPDLLIPRELKFDLIIAGNVITELTSEKLPHIAKVLENHLSPDGAIITIDPGTKYSSKNLNLFRGLIQKETSLHLYAPCLSDGTCPIGETDKGWCHEKIFWNPPAIIKSIDDCTGFTKTKGLKYSYFTFLKKKTNLSETYDVPTEKLWRVVSYIIKNKGEERLYVCNGIDRFFLRRLLKNASEKNSGFSGAKRGDLVFFDEGIIHGIFFDITKNSCFRILEH